MGGTVQTIVNRCMNPLFYVIQFFKVTLGLALKHGQKQVTSRVKREAPGLIQRYLGWSKKLHKRLSKPRKRGIDKRKRSS